MTDVEVHGFTTAEFAPLRQAFRDCFALGQHGGSVSVVHRGALVAELWGGSADVAGTRDWQQDTLVNVWSCTKGIAAVAMAMLVDRGLVDYDQPMARYWPEFAANGKGDITVGEALSHQGGLDGLSVPMDLAGLYAGAPYAQALAAMAPLWPPRSRSVYHAISLGVLVAEPLRRVSGQGFGEFLRDQIAGPLRADMFVGLPEVEEARVAELIEGHGVTDGIAVVLAGQYPSAWQNPTIQPTEPNTRSWRAAEIPGANGQATAKAMALIYGDLVSGSSKLLSPGALAEATKLRRIGMDAATETPVAYGAGFGLMQQGARDGSFGHSGWGGCFGFADPAAGFGMGYTTNHMLGFDDEIDPRRKVLVECVYTVLDGLQ
ncbi:serine hydrolase domain-containing protein [Cypionkella sp.]|uniref:serine hydrolase domain-containing protein n=1 Tax=Cypionkella sp. TaxID=2811411 RepID=UPI0027165D3D|nr:serine hydrolase domain-containing protein [Cypionkella sp.]MDO8984995.1 serine hydrolase domain-containing protein [Cypionkella sp.]MDP2047448.1 serine hydrolase domain-containing protein [Cypionkella sp.]